MVFFIIFQIDRGIKLDTIPEAWNYFTNVGVFGGELGGGLYGLSWPGNKLINNYYLFGSYFAVGAKVGGRYYVTNTKYPPSAGEWEPSDTMYYEINTRADHEILAFWDDFKSNPRNGSGRHLGVSVKAFSLSYRNEPYNDFIAYEIYVTYNSLESDIAGASTFLDSLYIGLIYDFDISGAGDAGNYIDDLYSYDGWTFGEWNSVWDSVTLLPDSFIDSPDGIWDQFTVWGDDPDEFTLHGEVYYVPRNIGYMYDGDNPNRPGNDSGENGASAGYVGIKLIYAPKSSSDSIWIDSYGDTVRWVSPAAFQMFTWENEPGTDEDLYAYLKGKHPATHYYRFVPPPNDIGLKEYDYRIILSSGPFRLYDGDTICVVFGAVIGQGMNGGYDSYWGRGWIRGLRQDADYLLKAYYLGSMSSDPLHPSSPKEDYHWVGIKEILGDSKRFRDLEIIYSSEGILLYSPVYMKVFLYDITGRIVRNINLLPNKFFKINRLKRGVYFVKTKNKTFKIIKIK